MLPYATPEWVEAMGKNYNADPDNQNKVFKGMTIFLTFRVEADPQFGIDRDIYFATHLVNGVYQPDSTLLSKEDAEKKSDFILTASPSVWKKMIKKEVGFVSAFMTNKIKLDKGSPPKVIALAPKSGAVVGAFNKIDTEWPDDMSPQRLQEYKVMVAEFRRRLKV
jgi:putative sterol carrier protein